MSGREETLRAQPFSDNALDLAVRMLRVLVTEPDRRERIDAMAALVRTGLAVEREAPHLLAALPAPQPDDALDVERLATAIATVRHNVNRNLAFARNIAAEYARLAERP